MAGMYYNPKVYHAASVDTAIASGKRVNYRIPGGKRTGNHPWFLSPYNKQSSLSTNGRAVGKDYYTTMSWTGNLIYVKVPDSEGATSTNILPAGSIYDITITSGPNAGDTFHRTVTAPDTTLPNLGFVSWTNTSDTNFGAVTKADGSAWSWLGVLGLVGEDYNCKITF